MESVIPLLDNATCSVIMVIVLWRFDSTVREIAQVQKGIIDELIGLVGRVGEVDDK